MKSVKSKMGESVRKAIIKAAAYGFNIPEIALNFCMNKHRLSHSQYLAFCDWAKKNEGFYYWLVARVRKEA